MQSAFNDFALGVRLNNRNRYVAIGHTPFDIHRTAEAPTREQQTRALLYNLPGLGKDSKLTHLVLAQLFSEFDFREQSHPLSREQQSCLDKVISLVRERERILAQLDRLTREFRDLPGVD